MGDKSERPGAGRGQYTLKGVQRDQANAIAEHEAAIMALINGDAVGAAAAMGAVEDGGSILVEGEGE